MKAEIVVLPGDGIGPEVVDATLTILDVVANRYGHDFEIRQHLLGGRAIDERGISLPEDTLRACLKADAILLGAVGGPQWDDPNAEERPERGLLGLRKELGLFANLRPVQPHPLLLEASPLRPDRLQEVDLLIIRELTGGIYFGEPRGRRSANGEIQAVDTMVYSQSEVQRVAHIAFAAAQSRQGKLTSVDKANVLESSRLWRMTVSQVSEDYPDVKLEHILVDAAAMHLITRPATFDVIVTTNMFGDILTDEASVLTGSMGNLPSASLGEMHNSQGLPRGLYEPIHGSAPDIAGKGIANPIGTILSLAMLLRHSLNLEDEAKAIESSVALAIDKGYRTVDLAREDQNALGTTEITDAIASGI